MSYRSIYNNIIRGTNLILYSNDLMNIIDTFDNIGIEKISKLIMYDHIKDNRCNSFYEKLLDKDNIYNISTFCNILFSTMNNDNMLSMYKYMFIGFMCDKYQDNFNNFSNKIRDLRKYNQTNPDQTNLDQTNPDQTNPDQTNPTQSDIDIIIRNDINIIIKDEIDIFISKLLVDIIVILFKDITSNIRLNSDTDIMNSYMRDLSKISRFNEYIKNLDTKYKDMF